MKPSDLAAELNTALAAMTDVDVREIESYGVSRRTQYEMVGLARIARMADTSQYEPDPTGAWAFITPVRVEHPTGPESRLPEACPRLGDLIDLVAWDPRDRDWALRIGVADWLGAVPPQYFDPDPVQVWRSPLAWLTAGGVGIVPLSREPAAIYSLLAGFLGGIVVENRAHAAELRPILERPWPVPLISVRATLTREVPVAAR